MSTTAEKIKFAAATAIISSCFGVGFYAGELAASASVQTQSYTRVSAQSNSGSSTANVSVLVVGSVDGEIVQNVSLDRDVEGGNVSVQVSDSGVEINGVEITRRQADDRLNPVLQAAAEPDIAAVDEVGDEAASESGIPDSVEAAIEVHQDNTGNGTVGIYSRLLSAFKNYAARLFDF